MNFTFENQGTNTYLVYAIGEDDAVDTMSLGMLTNNRIPGLAQTVFTQMDETKYIKYNVSSKVSVKQFFMGPVNKKRLIGVFSGILDAMLSSEEYMIDINTILLDLEYIFTDVSTCETTLICLPMENVERPQNDLGAFFKNIMFSTQFDQTENCDHVAKIINYLNSTPVLSLEDFKALLDDMGKTNAAPQPMVSRPAPQAAPQAAPQPQVSPAPQAAPQMAPQQPKPQAQPYVMNATPQPQQNKPITPQPMPQAGPVVSGQGSQPINMSIPTPAGKAPQQMAMPQAAPQPQASGEKQMSMMNLLMHYNKDNAELYKQQKAAKKAAAVVAKNASKTVAPQAASAPKGKAPAPAPNAGFAIPGQAAPNAGFAIPGQPTPAPQAIPQPMPQATPAPKAKAAVPTPAPTPVPQASPAPNAYMGNGYPASAMQTQSANFGETTILGGGPIGETTVLSASAMAPQEVKPFLIRTKNNEKIPLDKPVFRIGKEKSYVDYFIGDNTAISRSHANIVSRDGEYFVVDTNSTNHTYLNGQMLASNVETKITSGSKIRLANEDFEFKIQ